MSKGFSRRKDLWTPEEENMLRACVDQRMTDREIQALMPNRTWQAVHIHRIGMGLRKLFHFTPEEDARITEMFRQHISLHTIAVELKRSEGVIRQRVLRLGLRRNANPTHLVKRYGVDVLKLHEDPNQIRAILKEKADAEKATKHAAYAAKVKEALDAMLEELAGGAPRREAYRKARLLGATLQQIADLQGPITRERVRQITFDIKPGSYKKPKRKAPRVVTCKRCGETFTVTTAGHFLYCKPCKRLVAKQAADDQRQQSRDWHRNHPVESRAYQEKYLKLKREATLVSKLEKMQVEDPEAFKGILELFKGE